MQLVKAAGRILHMWLWRLWKPIKSAFHSSRKIGPFFVSTWDWEAQHATCCELNYVVVDPGDGQEPLPEINSAAVTYQAGGSQTNATSGVEPQIVKLT